jgi:hypothetical protein
VLPCSCFTEECVEGVITPTNGLVTRHLTIRLDTMFQTIQFPACISYLDTGLAYMDGNTLTLKKKHQGINNKKIVHKKFNTKLDLKTKIVLYGSEAIIKNKNNGGVMTVIVW